MLTGVFTALITPFKQSKLDLASIEKIIEAQIAGGIRGLVIAGSTGEGNNLEPQEYRTLLEHAIACAAGRIDVIATVGGTSTAFTSKLLGELNSLKLSAIMATAPNYVRPEQEGLYQHFAFLSSISQFPLIIYTHPGRTGVNIEDATIIRLSKLPNILALKDASGDLAKPLKLKPMVKGDFSFLCGDDINLLSYSANGGAGLISVLSNIMPKFCSKIFALCIANNFHAALELQQQLVPISAAIFAESNPIGIKHACSLIYGNSNELRLPLTAASAASASAIGALIDKIKDLEQNV
jgi:4-hydroxy-tetrahydrodipicolinate synthase